MARSRHDRTDRNVVTTGTDPYRNTFSWPEESKRRHQTTQKTMNSSLVSGWQPPWDGGFKSENASVDAVAAPVAVWSDVFDTMINTLREEEQKVKGGMRKRKRSEQITMGQEEEAEEEEEQQKDEQEQKQLCL